MGLFDIHLASLPFNKRFISMTTPTYKDGLEAVSNFVTGPEQLQQLDPVTRSAYRIVEEILGRSGIGNEFENCDLGIQDEILEAFGSIVEANFSTVTK